MTITPCNGYDLPACDTCRRFVSVDWPPTRIRLQPMVRDDDCADYVQGRWPVAVAQGEAP